MCQIPRAQLLPCRIFFNKEPRAQPGAIVDNKRLGAVLTRICADQQELEHQRVANSTLTLRQKDRIRAGRERPILPVSCRSRHLSGRPGNSGRETNWTA